MKKLEKSKRKRLETADSPILECRNLHRWLGAGEGRVEAVAGISFELFAGETCAITGPSGCGKSTLLYSLGLIDRIDEGTLFLEGEEVSKMSDERRTRIRLEKIGFVFQFHFLLSEFSALENVMLPMMRAKGIPANRRRERAVSLLERVGLADKMNRRANRLSGGEQQRVAVARALANAPALILADEPTGNLDESNADRVIRLLLKVAEEDRCAVVVVTHNPAIASRCHRQLRMRDGKFIGS